ncbi:MAG TPA: NADH-quinone oxidoreductase subunit J [Phycisphaerales bacterium]|jgi:NADH-quinone oxidoreductase subunit J|nr:NADH-quinone oxidoreductase subunit J [Phycisphaerales bacterium]
MPSILPYIATAAAALGLLLVLASSQRTFRVLGSVIGLASVGWLLWLAAGLSDGIGDVAIEVFFLIFAVLAIASAARMVAGVRPVYSALFFVLVVMSVCGMLVVLEAFFIAFSLVIVYAGAILITYMFVLMLAQQASDTEHDSEIPQYDRVARDPVSGVVVAALFMGIIVSTIFTAVPQMTAATDADQDEHQADLLAHLPKQLVRSVKDAPVDTVWPTKYAKAREAITVGDEGLVFSGTTSSGAAFTLPVTTLPGNTQHVGWMLVASFPASLELAGVILLMAMFGAVVLARRQIEHADEALAESVGSTHAGFEDDSPEDAS